MRLCEKGVRPLWESLKRELKDDAPVNVQAYCKGTESLKRELKVDHKARHRALQGVAGIS